MNLKTYLVFILLLITFSSLSGQVVGKIFDSEYADKKLW